MTNYGLRTAQEARLKRCPFCDSENVMLTTNPMNNVAVFCRGCGTGTKAFGTPKEAMDLWNTRK